MKLNKSILGLVVLAIFILSSCSQARYGAMTRRVKGTKFAQQTKKVDQTKKNAGLIIIESNNLADEADETVVEIQEVKNTTVFVAQNSATDNKEILNQDIKLEKESRLTTNKNVASEKVINKLVSNKLVNRKIDKLAKKLQPNESSEDLLRTVLIILLLLLLAGIVISILPSPLSWILSLVVTVILILYLIKLLM